MTYSGMWKATIDRFMHINYRFCGSTEDKPIFREHCIECHGETGEGSAQSGLSLATYDSVMSGTKFGPVVVPESSMSSALYLVIAQKTAPEIQMPPHHQQSLATGFGDALPENKVDIIRAWIDQGAKNN